MSTLLCPRGVSALPLRFSGKLPPSGANTLTQFVCPSQPVLKKECRPSGANPPAAVRVPRWVGAEKGAARTGANANAVRFAPVSRC